MEKRQILETLKRLGLNEYEAKAYTALTLLGPSKATEISKQGDLPQSKIYEVLDGLIEKQLIEVFDGRPKEFKAISPEVVFKSLMEEKEEQLKSLREIISPIISTLRPVSRGDVIEGIWTQKGERSREVLNRLAEMLDRCEKYAYDATRDFSYSSMLRESIKSCIRRKVKIFTISMSPIDENNYYKAKWYHAMNLPIKVFKAGVHPRILVIDGKEVSLRLDSNPLGRKFKFQSIWSQEPSLIKVFDSYMKNLWKNSTPVNFRKIPVPKFKP